MIYSFITFILLWYSSIFFHSIFLHRYITHKSFELSKSSERIFRFLSYLSLGSSYMSPAAYADMHKKHHTHTDKPEDPHSPKNEPNPLRFFWTIYKNYNRHFNNVIPAFNTFQFNNLLWWERIISSLPIKIIWVILYFILYYYTSKNSLISSFLTLITSVQGPLQGFLVNWFGHSGKMSKPKNFLTFDLILLGEAYHKNHHNDQKNPNFSNPSTQIDIAYFILRKLKIC